MQGRFLLGLIGTALVVVSCSQSDSAITTAVKSKLLTDDLVRARAISVDTTDRVVTLAGSVQSPAEENRALDIARGTRGVVDVIDGMSVAVAGEPGAAPTAGIESAVTAVRRQVDDGTIRSDVKARLLADSDLNSLDLDVDVRSRIVTLSGVAVTPEQKSHALEVASRADGVVRVEDNLLVRETPRPDSR